jgi:hypothetical protein
MRAGVLKSPQRKEKTMAEADGKNEANKVGPLVDRYLAACESVYPTAIANADIGLAAQIARSALSVVINASTEIGLTSSRPLAVIWFERLTSLYKDATPPSDVSRTLRWASTAMISVLGQNENSSSGHSDEHSSN